MSERIHANFRNKQLIARPAFLLIVPILAAALMLGPAARAQTAGILQQGDAVVTAFSGVTQWRYPKGAKPADYQVINLQGITLQVLDMSQMFGGDDARLIPAERGFATSAGQTGQVFGLTIDDGKDEQGEKGPPNIYAAATSAYGLNLLVETASQVNRTKTGGANVKWMHGQFGTELKGGPGSIWKIDGRTGAVSLFADVVLNGEANTGPALGNITFDPATRMLFVSDIQTGMIHTFDLQGNEVGIYDHGVAGRGARNLAPVAFDPKTRGDISKPEFNTDDPSTWGIAPPERRVWGLAVYDARLYYSVASGPDVWSVSIGENGIAGSDARLEKEIQTGSGDPISDIEFDADGAMYLAQRGQAGPGYDFTVLAKPNSAAVLKFNGTNQPDGRIVWDASPGEYPIGFADNNRNANGGIALGYGYYPEGEIRFDACKQTLWATGELLRQNPQYQQRLGEPSVVSGLQGNQKRLLKTSNVPPFRSYYIDYDDLFEAKGYRGHIGDVSIWVDCGAPGNGDAETATAANGEGGASGGQASKGGSGYPAGWKPRSPGTAKLKIDKTCSPAVFGGSVLCQVSLINVGDVAPTGTVGFEDLANAYYGPPASVQLLRADPSDPAWSCDPLPATILYCSLPGQALQPGKKFFVDVTVDVSTLSGTPGWKVENIATLSTDGTSASAVVGGDELSVSKTGPGTCVADRDCIFDITLTNFGAATFNANMTFSDDMVINSAPASGVAVSAVYPMHGCSIPTGGALPLQWNCPVTIPPYGIKTFQIAVFIPKAAGPATGTVPARNCAFAALSGLASSSNASGTLSNVLAAASGGSGQSPGMSCVDFQVEATNLVAVAPPTTLPPWPSTPNSGCSGRPEIIVADVYPNSFSLAGEPISFEYSVENRTTCDLSEFRIDETLQMFQEADCSPHPKAPGLARWGTWWGPLRVNETVRCTSVYLTTNSQQDIVNSVTLDSKW